ncbi:MAG TPA: CpsB/CapC family capsule biosynthesis tyrosine phosphatase [Longimicrobiales bacterium]
MKYPFELTDIHNHLVPAVDDGAQSLDEALHHLVALRAEGVTRLSVSPHLFGWLTDEEGALGKRLDLLERAFEALRATCARRSDVPELYFGQEILCPSPEIAGQVFLDRRPGYRDTDYALVEFGFDLRGDPGIVVETVVDAGRRIIVSHPERYRRDRLNVHIDELRGWKQAGALLQVNAGSLLGDYGSAIANLAWAALEEGLADLIATDHHADSRVVSLRAAAEEVARRGGDDVARLLASENPTRVLRNQEVLPVPSLPARQAT